MTAFVTGGSGFVGGALVRSLVADGIEVRALARSERASQQVTAYGATAVAGDILASDMLAEAVAGCDVVYHVAGINRMCLRDPASMYRVNVDGVRTVVAAAARAGASRVVLTSSAAAIGERQGEIGTEATEHCGVFLSHYARAKKLGEDAAFAAGRRWDIAVVAVNPTSVQGPGRSTGSARLLRYAMGRRRPLLIDAMVSLVDIEDCTTGHRLAGSHGRPGARYLLSGGSAPAATVVGWLSEVTGIEHRPMLVPRRAVAAGQPLARLAHRLFGGEVCPELLATLLHGHVFATSLVEDELGWRAMPLAATVRRTARWLASGVDHII